LTGNGSKDCFPEREDNLASAIQLEFPKLSRYADAQAAQAFAEQIAAYERVSVEQSFRE
jgi:hypothetical protein